MKLTAKTVGDILETTLGYRVEMNPYGFELLADLLPPKRARLRSGSGIAGNSYQWALVRLPDGKPISSGIRTKTQLVRVVLEFMAGPHPGDLPGHTKPRAKRIIVPRTGASRFVWYRRKKKEQGPRVALVPWGAAHR